MIERKGRARERKRAREREREGERERYEREKMTPHRNLRKRDNVLLCNQIHLVSKEKKKTHHVSPLKD